MRDTFFYLIAVVWQLLRWETTASILAEARRNGGALIDYETAGKRVSLVITHEPGLGYYLKYHTWHEKGRVKDTWLSLGDRTKLDITVGDSTSWICSVGLFIEPELAAAGVTEFRATGKRSSKIHWIHPESLPETGNW
jgi:hypothetical protein